MVKTVLCVPGHDERKVAKCREYGADLILFDLEDSVPADKKEQARAIVAGHVTRADAVRVNDDSVDDVRMLNSLPFNIHSAWLPKLDRWDAYWSLLPSQPIVIIVETPRLLSRIHSSDRKLRPPTVVGLAFGAADFAAYMNVPPTSPQVDYARQQVALAAAALGVEAYDSPCVYVDEKAVRADAEMAMDLGYGWKGTLHPDQVKWVKQFSKFVDSVEMRSALNLVHSYESQDEAVWLNTNGRKSGFVPEVVAPPMIRAARKRLEENK